MQRLDDITVSKNIEKVDEITLTFIDSELGPVRSYLMGWLNLIAYKGVDGKYIFRDNQEAAKKNAIILLQTTKVVPSPSAIRITGMRPSSLGSLTVGHAEEEPFTLTVSFNIDAIDLITY